MDYLKCRLIIIDYDYLQDVGSYLCECTGISCECSLNCNLNVSVQMESQYIPRFIGEPSLKLWSGTKMKCQSHAFASLGMRLDGLIRYHDISAKLSLYKYSQWHCSLFTVQMTGGKYKVILCVHLRNRNS